MALLMCGGCYSQYAVDQVLREHGTMTDTGLGVLDTHRVDFDDAITDEGFARVCPSLQTLHIELLVLENAHHITDASLPFIRQISTLHEVMLRGTQVTPAGVRQLKGMRHLRWVEVGHNPQFTRAEVERLRHDLPEIKVRWIDESPGVR